MGVDKFTADYIKHVIKAIKDLTTDPDPDDYFDYEASDKWFSPKALHTHVYLCDYMFETERLYSERENRMVWVIVEESPDPLIHLYLERPLFYKHVNLKNDVYALQSNYKMLAKKRLTFFSPEHVKRATTINHELLLYMVESADNHVNLPGRLKRVLDVSEDEILIYYWTLIFDAIDAIFESAGVSSGVLRAVATHSTKCVDSTFMLIFQRKLDEKLREFIDKNQTNLNETASTNNSKSTPVDNESFADFIIRMQEPSDVPAPTPTTPPTGSYAPEVEVISLWHPRRKEIIKAIDQAAQNPRNKKEEEVFQMTETNTTQKKLFLVTKTMNNTFNEYIGLMHGYTADEVRKRYGMRGNVDVVEVDVIDGMAINLSPVDENLQEG